MVVLQRTVAGSPDPRGRTFVPDHEGPYPAAYVRRRGKSSQCRGFTWAFALLAFASWIILCPLRGSAFLAVGLPVGYGAGGTSTGFPRSTHATCGRGGCPLSSGDNGVLHAVVTTRVADPSQGVVPASPRCCHLPGPGYFGVSSSGSVSLTRPAFPSPVVLLDG